MADSYRLTVLKRLTALLEETIPTPYPGIAPEPPANLAGCVFRGRSVFGESDPKWMLSILESPRPGPGFFAEDGSRRRELWTLLIQGWCPEDKQNPSDPVYGFADDVERMLERVVASSRETGKPKYPRYYMLGNAIDGNGCLITSFEVGPPTVRPPTDGVSSKCFFYIPAQVGLARISA